MAWWDDLSRFAGNLTGGLIGESDEERRRKQQRSAPKKQNVAAGNYLKSYMTPGISNAQSSARVASSRQQSAPRPAPAAQPIRYADRLDPQRRRRMDSFLDEGRSFEEISDQTGLGVEEVRRYTDETRPGYGVKPTTPGTIMEAATKMGAELIGDVGNAVTKMSGVSTLNTKDQENAYQAARGALERGDITDQKFFELTKELGEGIVGKKVTKDDKTGQVRIQNQNPLEFAQDFTDAGYNAASVMPVAGGVKLAGIAAKPLVKGILKEGAAWGTVDTANDVVQGEFSPEQMAANYALNVGLTGAGAAGGKLVQDARMRQTRPDRERGSLGQQNILDNLPDEPLKEGEFYGLGASKSRGRYTVDGAIEHYLKTHGYPSKDGFNYWLETNVPEEMRDTLRARYAEKTGDAPTVDKEAVKAQLDALRSGGKQQGYIDKEAPAREVSPEALLDRATKAGMNKASATSLMSKYGRNKFAIMLDESNNLRGATNPNALAASVLAKIPDGNTTIGGTATKTDPQAQALSGEPLRAGEQVLPDGSIVNMVTGETRQPTVDPTPTMGERLESAQPETPAGPVETPLGSMADDFFQGKKGNQSIKFRDLEDLGKRISSEIDASFKAAGSDFPTVARKVQQAEADGIQSLDDIDLTPEEIDLWRRMEAEMDLVRRRASLGGREVSTGDRGELYFPHQKEGSYATRDSLFAGFRDTRPGNENKRRTDDQALSLDEISYSPDVVGQYVTRYGDTKLLQEERIARAVQKNNPDADEETIREATQAIIDLQHDANRLSTRVRLAGFGKKVTTVDGKALDFAGRMREVGELLGRNQTVVKGTPRGLTNGDRLNSVDITYHGEVHTVGDFLGLNQFHDASGFAGRQTLEAEGDREALAEMVEQRLTNDYRLPEDDVAYIVEGVRRIKADLPDTVVSARVESYYRSAAKQQLMEQLQNVDLKNKTLNKDVSEMASQIVREGTIEQKLSAKAVHGVLRTTNALFRKLNVSSALNELSDLTSFFTVYGTNLKVATPDFSLIKQLGVGELDPALEPYIRQLEEGVSPRNVFKQVNEATRLYKLVETYKAGVLLKTARDFYSSAKGGSLSGDELTAKMLDDYRQLALPVDMFTKTFLNDYPLYTQYLSWGARNLQKEGRLLTGQIDAGLMKDKSTPDRIARDIYMNLPAKTTFWLASNGLKGTAIMTAVGLTDFTGLTSQDYSGIAEEDKNLYDRTTQFTNISTIASLANTMIQSYEKEQLKEKYKNADYNPYEHANLGDSLLNTYTPQFAKNIKGGEELRTKGYSENKAGRIQYEAPTNAWDWFKAYAFGKNQTSNAREYSGRENIADRVREGVNPLQAVGDMAAEQFGAKPTDYKRPLTEDYTKKYKEVQKSARTALLQGGRLYNEYLDSLKKTDPDLYNNYISGLDSGNLVMPEFWRNISQNRNGGVDLKTFRMLKHRKRQLKQDLGTEYDPVYDLPDDQAASVLRYMSAPTGEDLAVRNILNKEQWYKDFKDRRSAFFDKNPPAGGDFKKTERVKQWDKLDDELGSFYYDKDSKETPAWAERFPLVFQQKQLEFDSPESKEFFKNNYDAWKAQKDEFDKAQLAVINKMRKIEGYPEMSWEAYQQATEFADTDEEDEETATTGKSKYGYYDKNGKWVSYKKGSRSGGGSSNPPNTGVADTLDNLGNQSAGMKLPTGPKGKLKDPTKAVKKPRATRRSKIRIRI